MNIKLTLNINKNIIKSAKDYARDNKTSLSKFIENYLNLLVSKEQKKSPISLLVESLTGIIPAQSDEHFKKEYHDYLNENYSLQYCN